MLQIDKQFSSITAAVEGAHFNFSEGIEASGTPAIGKFYRW